MWNGQQLMGHFTPPKHVFDVELSSQLEIKLNLVQQDGRRLILKVIIYVDTTTHLLVNAVLHSYLLKTLKYYIFLLS